MPIINDSAILKSKDGFVRPSDLVGTETDLLVVSNSGVESYIKFTVEETITSYSHIRFSHGAILDLGYDTVMVGAMDTGYEGCKPKKTLDVVADIKRKFKYQAYQPSDFLTLGKKEQLINLEEFTDKKSGEFNLAQPLVYKFLGWAARTGRIVNDSFLVSCSSDQTSNYTGILKSDLPLEMDKVSPSKTTTRYYFKINWFIDVVRGLGCCKDDLFIADDLSFDCTGEMAEYFREGFIGCRHLRPHMKYNENAIRYDCSFTEDRVSDLLFLLHRAGKSTILVNDTKGYRISEQTPKWSHYVQYVTPYDVPVTMYKVLPINKGTQAALWISEVLFKATV